MTEDEPEKNSSLRKSMRVKPWPTAPGLDEKPPEEKKPKKR